MTSVHYTDLSIAGSTTPAFPKTPVLAPTGSELSSLSSSPLSSETVTSPGFSIDVAKAGDGFTEADVPIGPIAITTITAEAVIDGEYDDDDMPLFSLSNRSLTVATSRSSQKSLDDAPTSDTLVASPGVDRKMGLAKEDFVCVHTLSQENLVEEENEDDDDDDDDKEKEKEEKAENTDCAADSNDGSITSPKLSSFGTYPLYVGDLHPDVTEALLYSVFGVCGSISSVRICRDAMTQTSLGYAYVNFQTKEAAGKALKDLNYSKILGRECRIMPAINRNENQHLPPGSNIYVYHLHPTIESRALYDRFSKYGKVVSCKVVRNVHTGQSMCRGYVQFGTKKDADEAISGENGKMFGGSEIHVDSFVSREERLSTIIAKKAPAGILNVCGISPHCTEAELKKVFGMFGAIHSVYFTLNFNPRFVNGSGGYAIIGGTGWGYVNYYDASAARVARSVLNEVILKGVKLSVMERHDAGFHSDEPLQFMVVVRTFDKTIMMENIEDMVKDSVPLVEILSTSFKVYPRIEGASVQCATITAQSFDESEAIISGINSPSSPWRSLVACHAGQEATKFRPRYGYYYKHNGELGGSGGDEGRQLRGGKFGRQQYQNQPQAPQQQQQQQRRFDESNNSSNNSGNNNNGGNYHRNESIGRRDYYARRGHYGDNHHHHHHHHHNHQRNWRNKNDDSRPQQIFESEESGEGQLYTGKKQVSLPLKPREELMVGSCAGATRAETAEEGIEEEVAPPKGPAAQQTRSIVGVCTSNTGGNSSMMPATVYGGDAGYFGGWPIVDGSIGAAAVAAAAAATTGAYYGQYAAMYPHPHHHGYAAYYQYPTQEAYIGFPMSTIGSGVGGGSNNSRGENSSSIGGVPVVGESDISGNVGGGHQSLMMTQAGQRYHCHPYQQQQGSGSFNGRMNLIVEEGSSKGKYRIEENVVEEGTEEEDGKREEEEGAEEEEAKEGNEKGEFCGNGSKEMMMMMMEGHQRHYQQGQQYYGGRKGMWKREEGGGAAEEKIPREPKVGNGGSGRFRQQHHYRQYEKRRGRGGAGGAATKAGN